MNIEHTIKNQIEQRIQRGLSGLAGTHELYLAFWQDIDQAYQQSIKRCLEIAEYHREIAVNEALAEHSKIERFGYAQITRHASELVVLASLLLDMRMEQAEQEAMQYVSQLVADDDAGKRRIGEFLLQEWRSGAEHARIDCVLARLRNELRSVQDHTVIVVANEVIQKLEGLW